MLDMASSGEWYARWLPHVTVGEVPPVAGAVPLSDIIDQDVPRTKVIDGFCVDEALLAQILKAYASCPGAVPYTQGMSFVAALALWVSYGCSTSADKADVAFAYHLYRRMLEILGNDFFHVLVPTAFPQRHAEVPLLGLRTCIETMRTIAASVFHSRFMFSNGHAEEESGTLEDAVACVALVACSWLPKGMVNVGPLTLTLEAWDRAFLFGNISALAAVTIALITFALERQQQASQSTSHWRDEDAELGIGAMISCVKETAKSLDSVLHAQTLVLADAMVDEWRDIWEESRRIVHPQLISDATGKREISLIGEAWPQLRREDLHRIRLGFADDSKISPSAFANCLHAQGWSPRMATRLKNHLWPTVDDEDDDNANNHMTYAELIVALSRWANVGLSDKLRWIFDSFVRSYGAAGGGTVPLARLMGVHEAIFCHEPAPASFLEERRRSVAMSDPGEDDAELRGGLLDKRFVSHASVTGAPLLGNERVAKFFRRLQLISSLHNDASADVEFRDSSRDVSFNTWYMALISDRVLCAALQASLMPPFCPLGIGADIEPPAASVWKQFCHQLEMNCARIGQRIRRMFRRLRHG